MDRIDALQIVFSSAQKVRPSIKILIESDDLIADHDFDSLDMVELLTFLEEHVGEIDDTEFFDAVIIRDLADLVLAKSEASK